MELVEIIAPPEQAAQTRRVVENGVAGSLAGGLLGSVFGPYGAAFGVVLGGATVSVRTANTVSKPTAHTECKTPGCDKEKTTILELE